MSYSPKGDPDGRRLARRRASLLSEAGQLARVVEILLKRAEFDDGGSVQELVKQLADREKIELQKSHGRIESRGRFKPHVGHPLLEKRPRSGLYIDENGVSKPEPHAPSRPTVFSLGAIAMPEEAVDNYRVAAEIKQEFFGTTDFTFHEPPMRNREGPYRFDEVEKRQLEFDQAIDRLVRETNFVAFGVGIRKEAFADEFVETGIDPYLQINVYALAIMMLLERYIDFLAFSGETKRLGRVTFESIGPLEDAEHQLEYARLLMDGSQWVPGKAFRSWLETGLRFEPKAGSHPLELADMLSRDLYEWVRGDCDVTPKRWGLFNDKIYCRDTGQMGTFGIKVFPATDIHDRIDVHRVRCGAAAP
jgi:hypothetical protein